MKTKYQSLDEVVSILICLSATLLSSCAEYSPDAPYKNFDNNLRMNVGLDISSAYGFDKNPSITQLSNGNMQYIFRYTNYGTCMIVAEVASDTHKILKISSSGTG